MSTFISQVMIALPHKNEAHAREIIRTWVKNGLLVPFEYENPTTRKRVRGLSVDWTKKPS
jgi:hypothetical protein